MIDAEFRDENAEELERFLHAAEKTEREWKKERANMTFPSGKRKAQLMFRLQQGYRIVDVRQIPAVHVTAEVFQILIQIVRL